jgi:hypothetical protein
VPVKRAPIIISPPLADRWLAGTGPSNSAARRLTGIVLNGTAKASKRIQLPSGVGFDPDREIEALAPSEEAAAS